MHTVEISAARLFLQKNAKVSDFSTRNRQLGRFCVEKSLTKSPIP